MTTNQQITVLIVDDHEIMRTGIAALLEKTEDISLVGEAENGQQAVQRCEQLQPDVVLMDLMMPVMDGVAATRLIHNRYPETQIVIITSLEHNPNQVRSALDAGAIGYLNKDIRGRELLDAIRSAAVGKPALSTDAAQVLLALHRMPKTSGHDLTPSERAILRLMCRGLNNNQIGQQLNISRHTVKHHVSHILSKLGATSRTEAVGVAMERRLVQFEQERIAGSVRERMNSTKSKSTDINSFNSK